MYNKGSSVVHFIDGQDEFREVGFHGLIDWELIGCFGLVEGVIEC